jgi:signal transduction histidine kinase
LQLQSSVDQRRRKPRRRLFGDLKVRPKLMVLHNLFFLVLTCAVYLSLVPLFQKQAADAHERELALVRNVLNTALPGEIALDPKDPGVLYRKDPKTGRITTIRIPQRSYREVVHRVQITLFIVLGLIYVLAVLALELAIMPLYVYRPLRLLLNADRATKRGDREHEIIPEDQILGDEIGQIMRSRNEAIAELRRHEDHLEAALRRLEEQDRLASLGLLSASVAHELNTPLAVLHGSIEKLRETTRDVHTLERLSRMERVTQRLRRISAMLVDFARQRKQHMEPVALRPVVEEAWGLVAIDERAADIDFHNEVREADEIVGNADRLVQVFVNLLRNALNAIKSSDAAAQRGHIWVRSRGFTWNGKCWIAVTVEDNGPGIPAEVLPEMFEAFVTTQLDARGTGLGLAVTEGIVTQHGGTITASNRKEGGACIEVRFPASVPAASNTSAAPAGNRIA